MASYLSEELDTDISIGKVYFKPFTRVELHDLSVIDRQGDTIIHSHKMEARLDFKQILLNRIVIDEISSHQSYFFYQVYQDSTNIDFLRHLFQKPKEDKGTSKPALRIKLNSLRVHNNRFRLVNHNYGHHQKGIDFSDLDVRNIYGSFENIKTEGDSVSAWIDHFSLDEKSGFILQQLSSQVLFSGSRMEFKELVLRTNESNINDYLLFTFHDWGDFGDFIHKVNISASFRDSYVDSEDIEYFAPDMRFVQFKTSIANAQIDGTVSDLSVTDLNLRAANSSNLTGDVSIRGLPDIRKTQFVGEFSSLSTQPLEIESLVSGFSNNTDFRLPEQVHHFQDILFSGSFRGTYYDFDLEGSLFTSLGQFETKTHILIGDKLRYKSLLSTPHFEAGKLLKEESLQSVAFDLDIMGSGLTIDDLDLSAKGTLEQITLDNIYINKALIDLRLQDQTALLSSQIRDDKINADIDSEIQFMLPTRMYKVDGKVHYANLNDLKVANKNKLEIDSGVFHLDLQGNSLNNLIGVIHTDLDILHSGEKNISLQNLTLEMSGEQNYKHYALHSDILEASMQGEIDLNTLIPYFKSLAIRYAPAIGIDQEAYNKQNFELDIVIKEFAPLGLLINPDFTLADGAHLNAVFSSDDYTARFVAHSPHAIYKGLKVNNITIEENADDKDFSLQLFADRINLTDSTYVNHIKIKNKLAKDSLFFNIEASEKKSKNYLDLNGHIHFAHNKPAYIHLESSVININNERWTVSDSAQMTLSRGKLYVEDLWLKHKTQLVSLHGVLSNETEDVFDINFDHFNLSSLSGITAPLGIELNGQLNGSLSISSAFRSPYLSTNFTTSPILYNNLPIGILHMQAEMIPDSQLANIRIQLRDQMQRGLNLEGTYNIAEKNSIQMSGTLKDMELFIFQPFLKNLVSDLNGKVSGDLNIKGSITNPIISGTTEFTQSSFIVNYLQASYHVDHQSVLVYENTFMLGEFIFMDQNGNRGLANGIVDLNKLSDPSIDIDITARNLMVLNTTFKDNNLYYGKIYATGDMKFKGLTSAMNIEISASSDPHTVLTLPFNASTSLDDNDFIYFVSKDTSRTSGLKKKSFQGITMRLNMHLTPEAEVNIHTDMGSLSGNGNGEISMVISSLGDFEMFGDYTVNKGKFHFTAQDLFNKFFEIQQNGTIRWTGNPAEALINLTAIYQQRTSASPLYNAAGRSPNDQRVLAQADMILKGNLSRPEISFDLNFPQDPYIKDELQGYLSDINNVNQQALSLIVRRSFTPSSTEEFGKEVNNTLLSAGTEIAFNQLNNILSQSLNIDFFDLNIKSLNDASASLRFFNDRLVLSGGITDRRNLQLTDLSVFSDRIATDAELTYRLRKDGSLIIRANNRLNTRNFLLNPNDDYISAVGLVYRQEFDNIREFWRKLWITPSRQEEKEDAGKAETEIK